jgi:hypothetical protein
VGEAVIATGMAITGRIGILADDYAKPAGWHWV